jgi:IMP dehydrogenase/GMP reductase
MRKIESILSAILLKIMIKKGGVGLIVKNLVIGLQPKVLQ